MTSFPKSIKQFTQAVLDKCPECDDVDLITIRYTQFYKNDKFGTIIILPEKIYYKKDNHAFDFEEAMEFAKNGISVSQERHPEDFNLLQIQPKIKRYMAIAYYPNKFVNSSKIKKPTEVSRPVIYENYYDDGSLYVD